MGGDHNMYASGSGDGQRSGWRKRTIMEMALDTGFDTDDETTLESLERFAELVREDERNRTWTQEHWTEYERNIAAAEREACAKVCETSVWSRDVRWWQCATKSDVSVEAALQCAAAIRARSNT